MQNEIFISRYKKVYARTDETIFLIIFSYVKLQNCLFSLQIEILLDYV